MSASGAIREGGLTPRVRKFEGLAPAAVVAQRNSRSSFFYAPRTVACHVRNRIQKKIIRNASMQIVFHVSVSEKRAARTSLPHGPATDISSKLVQPSAILLLDLIVARPRNPRCLIPSPRWTGSRWSDPVAIALATSGISHPIAFKTDCPKCVEADCVSRFCHRKEKAARTSLPHGPASAISSKFVQPTAILLLDLVVARPRNPHCLIPGRLWTGSRWSDPDAIAQSSECSTSFRLPLKWELSKVRDFRIYDVPVLICVRDISFQDRSGLTPPRPPRV